MKKIVYIKYARGKAGVTQDVLAALVGVDINTVWRWENGRGSPNAEMCKQIAGVLGVSVEELLCGPGAEDWILEIRTGGKEVIRMEKIGCVSSMNCGPDGAVLTLGGRYETFQDETKFEGLIAQLRAARELVLRNGESLKAINDTKKGD